MDCSTPGLPVYHQLPEFTQTHVLRVGDTIQLSHPLLSFHSHLQSFPASGSFQMSQFCIRWPKYWSFSCSISPSNEYSELLSFRMDWPYLLADQRTLNDNPICKTEKETQIYRTDFWTLGEGEGGMLQENRIETCILSRVKQITNPGWMHETIAQAWCTGKTQRDWVEREVQGGSG